MMQWEFKKAIGFRYRLLKASTLFSFKEATAYAGNNYGNMASTIMYMITYLMFIGALFNRVKLVAGYNYSEVLFLTLVTQASFYIIWSLSISNSDLLAKNVKSGDLDLWITRPVPLLWFVSFQKININSLIIDAIPATTPLFFLLAKNNDFSVNPSNFVKGCLVFVMGIVISHCFQFMINLSCFWNAENQNFRNLSFELEFFGDSIPFEGYSKSFRNLAVFFIPSIVTAALSTSVMLGKSDSPLIIPLIFLMTILFLWLNIKTWNIALNLYSSASS